MDGKGWWRELDGLRVKGGNSRCVCIKVNSLRSPLGRLFSGAPEDVQGFGSPLQHDEFFWRQKTIPLPCMI